ncbi:MAG: hypothetical protein KatS3mg089_1020 [Patescibacteria group bacterium]|nr:MAG: hypothetical protein KatS3mg089_1020 [Patescibacteria group bacterium]
MNININKAITTTSILGSSALMFLPNKALAASFCPTQDKLQGLCTTTTADKLFNTILTYLLIAGALVAIIFLIWGGIKWITSGGDKTKVESARYTIIGAIIGLIVVFGSFLIINLVLKTFFGFEGLGIGGTGFEIPGLIGQ